MMRVKTLSIYLLILFMSLFSFSSNVYADLCDSEHIKDLKKLAEQVSVSYEYIDNTDKILSGDGESYSINSYSIFTNLISDELYLKDDYNEYYYDVNNGGIANFYATSGRLKLTVHSKKCAGRKLRDIYVDLPKFNFYSYREECRQLAEYELEVCNPWYQGTLNDNLFDKVINEYLVKEETSLTDTIINFFKDYYLIIVGSIVVILIIVGLIITHRKRSVLE